MVANVAKGGAMSVAIAVADGLTDAGLSIALDVLRAANSVCRALGRPTPFSIAVCSHAGRPVRAASGLRIGDLASFEVAARARALFVPGTWLETEDDAARWLASRAFARIAELVGGVSRRAVVLGSCVGTFALARAGLLDDREATTSWWLARPFQRAFPRVKLDASRALVAHARVATAGAVFAQADLTLHFVRTSVGPEVAAHVTRHLLLDEHRGQAPYMALHQLAADDELLRRAEHWMRARLNRPFDVVELARAVGASPRTLARRARESLGTSPGRWIRRVRAEEGARLLETSTLPIERVAERVGFGSAVTLRRELSALVGLSPREIRARARHRAPTK